MAAPSQRRALGTLFLVLCLGFAGVAFAAVQAGGPRGFVIAAAAGVLALWLGSLALQMLRRT